MIKNTLLVTGVIAFSVLWWIGLKKVMETPKPNPCSGSEVQGMMGK